MNDDRKYWCVVVSKDHLEIGKKLGIVQADHGKASPLKRMKPHDLIVFYSPKIRFEEKEPCKKFTAKARVKDGDVYQADMGGGFKPYRRDVDYQLATETDIEPLVPELTFIHNKKNWGYVFRFGSFEIPEKDFKAISAMMKKGSRRLVSKSNP